ncbi:MAG: YhcH/YjgK/YiaL family protein [Lentisphaeria bacterium]|nr:YhcH/YjgK/YiaL family protein [Lentisphaeria bacterium]
MILDKLDNAAHYCSCKPGFAKAFDFIAKALESMPEEGRYEIDGDQVYAMVQHCDGRGRDGAKLDTHRKYIDVQFTVSGREVIGWCALADCTPADGYDEEKDVELFGDASTAWIDLPEKHFAIFFPEDAHAPLAGEGKSIKIVVKIAI